MGSQAPVVDRLIEDIRAELNIYQLISPINEDEQKQLFLEGRIQEPQFKYSQIDGLEQLEKTIEEISPPDTPIQDLYRETVEELEALLTIADNLGNPDKTIPASQLIYGRPEPETVEFAYDLLKYTDSTYRPDPVLEPEDCKTSFDQAIQELGLDWDTEYTDKGGVSVNPSLRTVFIPQDKKFDQNEIERLVIHEIGVHVLRAENGFNQPYTILGSGTTRQHLVDEGITSFMEEITGNSNPRVLRKYASRAIAVNSLLQDNSFRETYEHLQELGVDENLSWDCTVRAYRAGGFVKDHIYLQGNLQLWNYLENGGRLRELYQGNTSIQEALRLSELDEIQQPEHTPHSLAPEIAEYW